MEINGQYLTYDEYIELGGTLTEPSFNLLEFNARKCIDKYTFGRLINLEEQSQETKLCEYELIKMLEEYNSSNETNNSTSKNIASESIDGYSISYANTLSNISQIEQGKDLETRNIIYTYLANSTLENGTPYLYRGI